MSARNLLRLYFAQRRRRAVLVQELFAIAGLAVGVALLFASQVASTSLDGSVAALAKQVIGHSNEMQLQARGPAGFSRRVISEVQRLPGVAAAMPVLEAPVNLRGPHGQRSVQLLAADPREADVGGPLLAQFDTKPLAALQGIALPAPIGQAIGARPLDLVTIQIGAHVTQTSVQAVLDEGTIGTLAQSPVALAPIAYAETLTGMRATASRLIVRPKHNRAALVHRALARIAGAQHLNLASGTSEAQLFAVASAPESDGELIFAAISTLVGFMLALNAMLMSVAPRRKLIDLAIAAGATRKHVLQILLLDTIALASLGALFGLILGDLLSLVAFRSTPGYLSTAFPIGDYRIITWQSVLIPIAAALTAAAIGVIWPLRDRILHPIREEHSSSTGRPSRLSCVQTVLGLCALATTTAILVAAPQHAVVGAIALVIAVLCLLPAVFDLLVRALSFTVARLRSPRARRIGAPLKLAVASLQAPPTRGISLAIARIGAVAVFGTVSIGGAQSNLQRGLDASAYAIDSSAAVWVTPSGQASILATTPFASKDQQALERIPGVAAVGLYRGSFLDWGTRRLWVQAQPPQSLAPVPAGQLLDGTLKTARRLIRKGGWAVLSAALADEHHLRIGQPFTLPTPAPITLRVAALATNLGWPPGAIVMSSTDYARAWRSTNPSAYELQTSPGTSANAIKAAAEDVIGTKIGLRVETLDQRAARHYALAAQGLARLRQIRLLVLATSILATIAAIAAMLWHRRDQVARLKCLGYDPAILRRWLAAECSTMLAAGCIFGAIAGIYGEVLNTHALANVTGFPVFYQAPVTVALSNFALVAACALVIVLAAGYLVVRVPVRTTSPAY